MTLWLVHALNVPDPCPPDRWKGSWWSNLHAENIRSNILLRRGNPFEILTLRWWLKTWSYIWCHLKRQTKWYKFHYEAHSWSLRLVSYVPYYAASMCYISPTKPLHFLVAGSNSSSHSSWFLYSPFPCLIPLASIHTHKLYYHAHPTEECLWSSPHVP